MIKAKSIVICLCLLLLSLSISVAMAEPTTKILGMVDRFDWGAEEDLGRFIQEYDLNTGMLTEYQCIFRDGYFISGKTSDGALLVNDAGESFDLYHWKNGNMSESVDSIPKGELEYVFAYWDGWFFGYNERGFYRANSKESILIASTKEYSAAYSEDGRFTENEFCRPAVSMEGSLAYFDGRTSDYGEDITGIDLSIIRADGTEKRIPFRFKNVPDDWSILEDICPAILWLDEERILIFYQYEDIWDENNVLRSTAMWVDVANESAEPFYSQNGTDIFMPDRLAMGYGGISSDGKYGAMLTSTDIYTEESNITNSACVIDFESGKIIPIFENHYTGLLNAEGTELLYHDDYVYPSAIVVVSGVL